MTEFSYPIPSGITKLQGRDYNYFNKIAVSWSAFGGGNSGNPDVFIPFSTDWVQFINLTVDGYVPTSSPSQFSPSSVSVVEYSFNGNTVHGELGSGAHNVELTFQDRVIGLIWFRLQSGSGPGTVNVSVQAFGIR
jgi:hypothetical protein